MEFRKPRPENAVLKRGQDLIADPFVKRHPTAPRGALVDHARAKNRVRFGAQKRPKQLGQFFRGVLTIAMDQRDNVETIIDRIAITELLIAAITLVLRRA